MYSNYNLVNFMQGRNHYIQAKQNIASGRQYTELSKAQRKALRREKEISNLYMSKPPNPDTLYGLDGLPSVYLQNKRLNRLEDTKSDIYTAKRTAQLSDNYIAPYDSTSMQNRLQNSSRFKDIQKNPNYFIGMLNPLENDSKVLYTPRNTFKNKPEIREIHRDYNTMSNDYEGIGHDITPGSMPENLIEDMSHPAHIVPLYNNNTSYEGNFLRSSLGFSPMKVRKLKSGELPSNFVDIPKGKTIY